MALSVLAGKPGETSLSINGKIILKRISKQEVMRTEVA